MSSLEFDRQGMSTAPETFLSVVSGEGTDVVLDARSDENLATIIELPNLEVLRRKVNELHESLTEAGSSPAAEVTSPLIRLSTATEKPSNLRTDILSPARRRSWIEQYTTRVETGTLFKHRLATLADIEEIVDVDIRAFQKVYEVYDQDPEQLRQELVKKFSGRLEKTGGKWLTVLINKDKIVGFMNSCPTSKSPEDFRSWEETTNNGTLDGTYDPDGKNVYIVSLSMLPEGSRDSGQNMLFAQQMANFVRGGYERAFFESRLPGLRIWMQDQCIKSGTDIEQLTAEQKQTYAEQYLDLRTIIGGKEVRKDKLNRIYDASGCSIGNVVAGAYKDHPSMDFGVVRIFENPLPKKLQKNLLARYILGGALSLASRSHWLMQKAF